MSQGLVVTTATACPCCGATPPPIFPSCNCALEIPAVAGIAAAFADEMTAVEWMDGTFGLADCFGWMKAPPAGATFSADTSTEDELVLSASYSGSANATQYAQIDVAASTSLTISWSLGSSGTGSIVIYECDGTPVETTTISGATGSHTFAPLPSGQYIIACNVDCDTTAEFDVVADDTMVVNPVIASFLDGADTWKLEQCPRLEWPLYAGILTGPFPDLFFATTALAATTPGLTDPDYFHQFQVGCLGLANLAQFNSGSASASGLTYSVLGTADEEPSTLIAAEIIACLSLEKGAVLTSSVDAEFNTGGGGPFGSTLTQGQVFEPDGTFVGYAFSNTSSGMFSFTGTFTVPHTGRFYVRCFVVANWNGTLAAFETLTVTFSSDLPMVANPVQALYSRGVTCPGRLDCSLE